MTWVKPQRPDACKTLVAFTASGIRSSADPIRPTLTFDSARFLRDHLYTNERVIDPSVTSPVAKRLDTDRDRSGAEEYVLERQVGHLLRRAHQRHAALFQERIGSAALTPMQWAALFSLVQHGPTTQNKLGRLTAMDPATIQGVVRRLVGRGLVVRSADPSDRRTRLLAATEAGHALATATLPIAREISDATLAPLDEAERALFLKLLTRMAFA